MVKFAKLMDFTPHEVLFDTPHEVLFEKLQLLNYPDTWGNYIIEYHKRSKDVDIIPQDGRDMMLEDKILIMRSMVNRIEVLKQRSLFE